MDIRKVATLAKLDLTPEEEKNFTPQLEKIFGYIDQLKEVDTAGVPPTEHVVNLHNIFREDLPQDSLPLADVLTSASEKEGSSFVVAAVIQNS